MKPRTKIAKKKEIIRRKKYDPEKLQKALAAVQQGMSKKLAAKTFEVPRSTLQFRCNNPDKLDPRPGPATVLSKDEEESIVKWIILSGKKGFPKRKEDLQYSVSNFLKDSKRPNPFKENSMPGEKWMKLFMKRHPEVTIRTSEAVSAASSAVAEKDIKGWFSKIKQYLKENGLFEILSDPSRILNGDETNFQLCPKTGTVLAKKGEKNVYEIDRGQAKSAITVMFSFAANGELTPPMVIFPYKRLPGDIAAKVPADWGIGLSDNGWMKADIFYDYVKNILHPHLKKENVKFPVIFFVDGHKTHMTLQVSELCSELQIVLIALYPNSTRILQPADVSAFYPLKCGYRKSVLEWRREHPSQALTKLEFVPILQKAIKFGIKPDTIKNGFRACGLFPWDPNAVNYTKCLGSVTTKETPAKRKQTVQEKVIAREIFLNVVGIDILKELEQKSNKTYSEKALQNLWNFFQHPSVQERESPILTEPLYSQFREIENVDPNIQIEDLDVIIASDNLNMSPSQKLIITENLSVNVEDDNIMTVTRTPDNTSNPFHKVVVNSIEIYNKTNEDILTVQTEKVLTENKVEKQQKKIDLIPVKLQDLLVLPKTPCRKGTKNSERISFVLTSEEWQRKENEKKRIKQEKEDAVKKRKEEREFKKTLPKPKQVKKEKKEKNIKLITQNTEKQQNQKLAAIKKQLFSSDFYNIASTSRQSSSLDNASNTLDSNQDMYVKKDTKNYTDAEIEKMLSEFED